MATTFKLLTGMIDELISPQFPKATYDAQAGAFVGDGPVPQINNWLAAALAQEPADDPADLTKRGPVTRWIGYAFGNPRMTKSQAMAILPIQPGDPNPFFTVIDAVKREGAELQIGSAYDQFSFASPIVRDEWLKVGYAMLAVLTGGDVTGMPVFFELTALQLEEEVSANFPNRTISTTDPNDPEAPPVVTVKTWAQWGDPAVEIDGKYYKSNQDRVNLGIPLPASVWALSNLVILSVAEYKALQSNTLNV